MSAFLNMQSKSNCMSVFSKIQERNLYCMYFYTHSTFNTKSAVTKNPHNFIPSD